MPVVINKLCLYFTYVKGTGIFQGGVPYGCRIIEHDIQAGKQRDPNTLKVVTYVSFSGNSILLHSVPLCHYVNTSLQTTSQVCTVYDVLAANQID
jgi:hypothetical protein